MLLALCPLPENHVDAGDEEKVDETEDGRHDDSSGERKVARGGSWADRPADAGSTVRRAFESWQKVHDVGFRVIMTAAEVAVLPGFPPLRQQP